MPTKQWDARVATVMPTGFELITHGRNRGDNRGCRRLIATTGIGPVTATARIAAIGNGVPLFPSAISFSMYARTRLPHQHSWAIGGA